MNPRNSFRDYGPHDGDVSKGRYGLSRGFYIDTTDAIARCFAADLFQGLGQLSGDLRPSDRQAAVRNDCVTARARRISAPLGEGEKGGFVSVFSGTDSGTLKGGVGEAPPSGPMQE